MELKVTNLQVRFGGVIAVDGVSLTVPTGSITGLIGPNGAGKTTTFNAISGLLRPSSGRMALAGRALGRRGAAARARQGLGRTFQKMELFDSLRVAENVRLGREGSYAGSNPLSHFLPARGQQEQTHRAAAEAMRLCGIEELADEVAGSLSTGQRRLVELARCLASPSRIMLLDEPSSGLDRAQTVRFGAILRKVVQERGLGILLVEHDMSLVTKVCDYIYVLDFGKPIFEGTAQEVMSSPAVRAAYLGDEEAEDAAGTAADSGSAAEEAALRKERMP
ncbi:ABC transporter ATP-binding protein [Streptomyces sp. NPDC054962]